MSHDLIKEVNNQQPLSSSTLSFEISKKSIAIVIRNKEEDISVYDDEDNVELIDLSKYRNANVNRIYIHLKPY